MSMPEDNCPICKDVFNDKVTRDPCGHEFCKSCLDQWYKSANKNICPFCRQTNEESDNLYFHEDDIDVRLEELRERIRQDIQNRENILTFNTIYNLEDVYSGPSFEDLSYESPIYLQTIDKINDYYNDINGYYNIESLNQNQTMNRATITVNCTDRVIVHRNYGRYEDFSKAMAIYLMKYLYNSSYSPFNPESNYHYSNDENNYRFSEIDTNETIISESKDTKIINITITNTDNLFVNRYIIFENNNLEKSPEWVLYDSIYKRLLYDLSLEAGGLERKIFTSRCEINLIISPKVSSIISDDEDDYTINSDFMIDYDNHDIYRCYDKIVDKLYPEEIERAEFIRLEINYDDEGFSLFPVYNANVSIF